MVSTARSYDNLSDDEIRDLIEKWRPFITKVSAQVWREFGEPPGIQLRQGNHPGDLEQVGLEAVLDAASEAKDAYVNPAWWIPTKAVSKLRSWAKRLQVGAVTKNRVKRPDTGHIGRYLYAMSVDAVAMTAGDWDVFADLPPDQKRLLKKLEGRLKAQRHGEFEAAADGRMDLHEALKRIDDPKAWFVWHFVWTIYKGIPDWMFEENPEEAAAWRDELNNLYRRYKSELGASVACLSQLMCIPRSEVIAYLVSAERQVRSYLYAGDGQRSKTPTE